jgi:hypothetical protein
MDKFIRGWSVIAVIVVVNLNEIPKLTIMVTDIGSD